MTRTLFFYLSRQILIATLIVGLVLSSALWLAQSIHLVELVVNGGAPIGMFFTLMGLTFPNLITPILPLCFFFGVVFVYLRLYQDSELIVLRGMGLSPGQLAFPMLMMGVIVMVLHWFFTLSLAPESQRQMRSERHTITTEYSAAALREGTFNSLDADLTVYVHERLGPDRFRGIVIHDTRNDDRAVTITAAYGTLVHNNDNPRLVIQDGTRQERMNDTGQINWLQFDEYAVDLNALQPDRDEGFIKAGERPLSELLNPPADPLTQRHRTEFFAEAHQRLASPFWVLAFGTMALTVLFCGAYRRRGIFTRVVIVCFGAIILQGLLFGLHSVTERANALVPFLYIMPLAVFAGSSAALYAAQRGKL